MNQKFLIDRYGLHIIEDYDMNSNIILLLNGIDIQFNPTQNIINHNIINNNFNIT